MANCATNLFSFDVRERNCFSHVVVVDHGLLELKEEPNSSSSDVEEKQRECMECKVRARSRTLLLLFVIGVA